MRTPFDVTGLGLTRAQSAVLAAIAEQGAACAVYLSGRLDLSAEAVSRALSALCDLGLVVRGQGRPRPVTLAPAIGDSLTRLRTEVLQRQRQERVLFDRARRELTDAIEQRGEVHLPVRGLAPSRPVPINPNYDLHHLTSSWDEITTAAAPIFDTRGWIARRARGGVRIRLLVTGPELAARTLAGARDLGAQVRHTTEELARLLIVDQRRARVAISTHSADRHGWTEDRGQLRLLQDGFEAAWSRAA